ncbi:formate dehydrogenase, alpha subunit [Deferribacter desulfuricans SSM1]|uniref:Formate dehydrogenase, alpha subunit n=1 Tax=Deferribacter desulfuricans (strain DSM 14783 / JCM 11476 / NBRC 101012 / SSM1) TaxID=639282 RepID=D3PDQ4_DEFDS|nr:formate dehydrogenase subunit alpha [Deferribacter desulfuricans]BAI80727.1 formate dehydrogenase, alpha subunit [Deferribacter desulfuricans SSM1]
MIKITINGADYSFKEKMTIIDACESVGIYIPKLCYDKRLKPIGRCKLCIVKVNDKIVTACETKIEDGMDIITNDEELRSFRKINFDLLVDNIYVERVNDISELSKLFKYFGYKSISSRCFSENRIVSNPFFSFDNNLCVQCGRCVSACKELQCRFVWNFAYKGKNQKLTIGADESFEEALCEFCGTCVDFCPTGAIKNNILLDEYNKKSVETVCSYCGVGCKINLSVDGENVLVTPKQTDDKYNSLCVKGRYGHSYIFSEDRLKSPLVRKYLLDDGKKDLKSEFIEVDWDTALDIVSKKLVEIKRTFGGDSIGFFSSAKCTNEENYLLQKLARQIIGTNNVDHCARLCHSSTVVGLIQSVGSGAMTNTMDDIVENASTVFIIGSNVTEQHPVFGVKIRRAVMNRKINLIVADPRYIDIVDFSDIYLPIKPGSDVALMNALCKIIIENGWEDKDYINERCENYEEFKKYILSINLDECVKVTGIDYEILYKVAKKVALEKPTALIWAMGITQHNHGVDNVFALSNLQLLTGNIGVSGGGLNPLRGQNNVQGACDMGCLPDVFNGYQRVMDEEIVKKFENFWKMDGDFKLSRVVGKTVTEMVDSLNDKSIRALYIMGENPVMTEPDVNRVVESLKNADFLVVQDIFPTETSKFADVILPASSFAEKEGTFTNTERKINLIKPVIKPLYNSKPDLFILSELANRLIKMLSLKPMGVYAKWDYESAKDVLDEINATTPIYGYAKYERLLNGEDLYWPVYKETGNETSILHQKKFSRGKGKLHIVLNKPPKERPNEEFPFVLNTGRELYHWHGGELTRRVKELLKVCSEPIVMLNTNDAKSFGIKDGELIKVISRRGKIIGRAFVTERLKSGEIFGNFHFPDGNVNKLTIKALDSVAKIPEYKVCAVKIERVG